jgi:hypothetical protein
VQTLVGPLSNIFYHPPAPADDQGYDDETAGYSRLNWTHQQRLHDTRRAPRDLPPPILCRGDPRCAV